MTPPDAKTPERRAPTLASDVGALGVLQLVQRLSGPLLLPLISKQFGAAGYGVWTLFFVVGEMLGTLCDLALDEALVRFVPGVADRQTQQEYFYSLVAITLGLSLVPGLAFLLAPLAFARLTFGSESYAPFVQLLGFYLMMETFDNLALNMLRALLKVKLFVYLEASQTLVRLALVAGTFLLGKDLWTALAVSMGVQFIWLIVEAGILYAHIGLRWPTFSYVRACLAYRLPIIPTRYSTVILNYSDRWVITSVLGPTAGGIYAAAYDLALIIWQIANPVRVALYPTVSRLWDQGAHEEAGRLLSHSLKFVLLLSIPALVGLSVLGPNLLQLLATAEIARASTWLVLPIGVGVVCQNAAIFFSLLLRLHRDTRAIAIGLVVSASLHLGLNLLLIPRLGIIGGAWSTLVGYGLNLILLSMFAWRHSRFPLPKRAALLFTLAAGVMAPIVIWVNGLGGWLGVLGAMVAGGVTYLAVVLLTGGLTWRELVGVAQSLAGTQKLES